MDLQNLNDDERLVAEQAVAAFRMVRLAGESAPHGKGLFCLEEAVHEHGFPLLNEILRRSLSAHPEAQKKGRAKDQAG